MLLQLWCIFSMFFSASSNYLNGDNYSNKFLDVPTTGIIKKSQYPYIGFGCTVIEDDSAYLISSSHNPYGRSSNLGYKCGKTINPTNEILSGPTNSLKNAFFPSRLS